MFATISRKSKKSWASLDRGGPAGDRAPTGQSQPRKAQAIRYSARDQHRLLCPFSRARFRRANLLVGTKVKISENAWAQTYRALDHGFAKSACAQVRNLGFSIEICLAAEAFVSLQERRHEAVYNPLPSFSRGDAIYAIELAESTLAALKSCGRKDRRAFAVRLLLRRR